MASNDEGTKEVIDKYPFLSFKDWIERENYESKKWLVVAQHSENPEIDDFRTRCALASVGSGHLERLISNPDWEINWSGADYFGAPFFEESDKKEIIYRSGQNVIINDISFQPLVIFREFEDQSRDHFEVSQTFILYYNAFYVESEHSYQRINEKGDTETVVRIMNPKQDEALILMNAHLLKYYLAANQSYLVRYHDHRRVGVDGIPEEHQGVYRIATSHSCFDLILRKNTVSDEFKSSSRLIGKDIMEPYQMPDKRHWYYLTGEEDRRFVQFIIGHDENGKEKEETCDERELSSYFKDRGTVHFLTPVYFRKEVLFKYINQPSWKKLGIDYNRTDEGLIMVWLGDLGRISYEEQMYWRSFNVASNGMIPNEVFMRDIVGILVEPKNDVVYEFRKTFELLQKKSSEEYNEPIIKPLRDRDQHNEDWIRTPIVDTWREFDDQILALAKLTSDSLNVELLTSLTGKKIDPKGEIKGPIDLLAAYLEDLSVDDEKKEQIVLGLRMVQKLRSSGVAHRSGDEFNKQMKRFNLGELTKTKAIETVVIELTQSLRQLATIIDSLH